MLKFFKFFANLLILLLCHQIQTINAATARIVGGEVTTIEQVKYAVNLRSADGSFFCGGTLVKQQYVVTAAHCLKNLKPGQFTVHGGATFLNQEGIKRSVTSIARPKAFNFDTLTMDVAVLKLDKPMIGKNIETIPLCSHQVVDNDLVKVSGWGKTDENLKTPSEQLRTVNVRIINKQVCQSNYRGRAILTETMICASVNGVKDSCSGDSGGPAVHNNELCGIVSFGRGCARRNFPGIYTSVNVPEVKQFINNAIAKMNA